jgi:AraC family transcriptional regulator
LINVIRASDRWHGFDSKPTILLQRQYPSWGAEFQEVQHGPAGSIDRQSTVIHVATVLNPIHHRVGGRRKPFLLAAPSAAVVIPDERMYVSWEGEVRAHDLFLSSLCAETIVDRPLKAGEIEPRAFAFSRDPDATDEVIAALMNALKFDILSGTPSGSIFAESVVAALLHHIIKPRPALPRRPEKAALTKQQLARTDELIEANLTGRLSLLDLAANTGVSVRHFCRAFRASKEISPHQYVIRRRVERAQALIEAGDLTYAVVAEMAGFADQSQMTKTFRRVLGVTPSHFRSREEE